MVQSFPYSLIIYIILLQLLMFIFNKDNVSTNEQVIAVNQKLRLQTALIVQFQAVLSSAEGSTLQSATLMLLSCCCLPYKRFFDALHDGWIALAIISCLHFMRMEGKNGGALYNFLSHKGTKTGG